MALTARELAPRVRDELTAWQIDARLQLSEDPASTVLDVWCATRQGATELDEILAAHREDDGALAGVTWARDGRLVTLRTR